MTAKTAEELRERLQANVHAVISQFHGCEPPDGRSTWPSEDALMVTAKAYAEALAALAALEETHLAICLTCSDDGAGGGFRCTKYLMARARLEGKS